MDKQKDKQTGKQTDKQTDKQAEKHLYILACLDEDTAISMESTQQSIQGLGLTGHQTPNIPFHLTLARFHPSQETVLVKRLQDICDTTPAIPLSFNSLGLFGLHVLFLSPNPCAPLLALHTAASTGSIADHAAWTPHATLWIDEPENILRALPIAAEQFRHLDARIDRLCLYEFFPTRFIGSFPLRESAS
jgi:2'-5' RNA ligase